jgi:hypothetical protein
LAVLQQSFALLRNYLGDVPFMRLGKAFFAQPARSQKTLRMYCNTLPNFLISYRPFSHNPELQELATLELALNQAFEAADVKSRTSTDSASLNSVFPIKLHPSVRCLTFHQNTTSIWSALKCEQKPPKPHVLDQKQNIIVWRQGVSSRFRIMGEDEALALKQKTISTSNLYFRGWIEAELLLPADIFEK